MLIVANGQSARLVDFDRIKAPIIAVNGAIDWLPRADLWFPLDMSEENRQRFDRQRPAVKYIACGEPGHVRRVSHRGAEPADKSSPEWWRWRWSANLGLSEDPGAIHTGNSAYGALGLAYHMRPKRIVLCGVDADDQPRIDGKMTRSLAHLSMLFESALPQLRGAGIEVVNASPWSRVTCFPKIDPAKVPEWII
ncbi:MAG: norphogenetic protein [Polycyclovorans sp.]|nr:norphogenetic protein [Polycyclovorans sp.]